MSLLFLLSFPPLIVFIFSSGQVNHRGAGAQPNLERVERFISLVGVLEDQIFQKRMRLLKRDKQRRERDRQMAQRAPGGGFRGASDGLSAPQRGPGKWTAAAPNAAYMASLVAVPSASGTRGFSPPFD